MKKKKFSFKGSIVSNFEKELARNWVAVTFAVSEKQAFNNLSFRAKKELGLAASAKIKLVGKMVEDVSAN